MSKTQRFRRLFLLLLIFWGITGGLLSLHTCLGDKVNSQSAYTCCCDNGHVAKKELAQDCCKTITSYVGIPLYFIQTNNALPFISAIDVVFSDDVNPIFNNNSKQLLSIHPPPENLFLSVLGNWLMAMRI